jgi:hypothetical protein
MRTAIWPTGASRVGVHLGVRKHDVVHTSQEPAVIHLARSGTDVTSYELLATFSTVHYRPMFRLQVPMEVTMKITATWHVTPSSLIYHYRRFGRTCFRSAPATHAIPALPPVPLLPVWTYSSAISIGVARWFENLVTTNENLETCSSLVVKLLCYKPEGCGFKTRLNKWILSIYLILPAALGLSVYSASNRNGYQRHK